MLKNLTLEKAINIIRLSVALSFCWPLRASNSKAVVFCYRVMQICTAINISLLLLPTLYTVYLQSDVEIVSHCVGQAICEVECIVQTIICFSKYNALQRVIEELWSFIEGAQRYEKDILHEYIARVDVFYGGYIVTVYVIGFVGLIGPIFFPIVDLIFAEYPFDVNNQTFVSAIIHAQQIIACYQSTADIRMLPPYIEKHLRLNRYAEEVADCFRFMVLFVIAACTFVITLCALAIVTNTPLIAKILFVVVTAALLIHIYMYAWPADHMKEMSLKFSQSVYDLPWYEHTARKQKDLLNALVYQKPVILSISCLLPELSLHYYCSYLSNALSFCTALRAILEETTT